MWHLVVIGIVVGLVVGLVCGWVACEMRNSWAELQSEFDSHEQEVKEYMRLKNGD